MNTNSLHATPATEESYQGVSESEINGLIPLLIEMGILVPSVSIVDCINSWEPYELRITFESLSPITGNLYLRQLRRLFRSVNLRLRRRAGFPAVSDNDASKVLQMISGYVIVQCHEDRPRVEVVGNVNSRYGLIDCAAIKNAFLKSGCYQSIENPSPLFDQSTLVVTELIDGVWDSELFDQDPFVLSLVGRRLILEY